MSWGLLWLGKSLVVVNRGHNNTPTWSSCSSGVPWLAGCALNERLYIRRRWRARYEITKLRAYIQFCFRPTPPVYPPSTSLVTIIDTSRTVTKVRVLLKVFICCVFGDKLNIGSRVVNVNHSKRECESFRAAKFNLLLCLRCVKKCHWRNANQCIVTSGLKSWSGNPPNIVETWLYLQSRLKTMGLKTILQVNVTIWRKPKGRFLLKDDGELDINWWHF